MIKKLMILFLTLFFLAGGVLATVTLAYYCLPSRQSEASISLPAQIEDPEDLTTDDSTEFEDNGYDNIYIADVHQSLTLRTAPNSDSAPLIEEGLAPMTHMQVIEVDETSNFAYVKVINGPHEGRTGYVNCDYITRLGEPTIRVDIDDEP
ncbi:MAG: hypothetical protein Q4E53_00800 [Eubacteriales bacterium]|nr:hypothetical protein [Eubacteriales bacterium]